MSDKNSKRYSGLKPFKPGQSGNPAGLKKGTKQIAPILRKLLAMEWTQTDDDGKKITKTGAEWQALKIFHTALNDDKNFKAMELLLKYVDGLPKKAIELTATGSEEGDTNFEFNVKIVKTTKKSDAVD